jgi:hypothetical protein
MYVWMYKARFFPLVAYIFLLNARKARKHAVKGKRFAINVEKSI